jgi:acyl-CoA thioesterase
MLLTDDRAAQGLGLEILDVALGRVRAQMTVRPDMANAFGICHGGFIFSLADSAFGYACNSYGDEMVAAGASIEFVAPALIAARLTATATETMRTARHGLYDVVVTDDAGGVVAHFRGRCSRRRVSSRPAASH